MKSEEAIPYTLQRGQFCAQAADRWWHVTGLDKAIVQPKNMTDSNDYVSHYNSQLQKCFINVREVVYLPTGHWTRQESIYDAIEGGDPLAETSSAGPMLGSEPKYGPVTRHVERAGDGPSTLEWFKSLMSK